MALVEDVFDDGDWITVRLGDGVEASVVTGGSMPSFHSVDHVQRAGALARRGTYDASVCRTLKKY